jgi:receptor expression-enhancing protein 5/6
VIAVEQCNLQLHALFFSLQALGAPKEHVVAAGVVLLTVLVFAGLGAGPVCNLISFAYPAYHSFRAIETESTADDTQWYVLSMTLCNFLKVVHHS